MPAIPLPIVAGCGLDKDGLRTQLERYRSVATDSTPIARTHHRVAVTLASGVDETLVAQIVAVERSCCAFFTVGWDPESRRLEISITDDEHARALAAVALALGAAKTSKGHSVTSS